MPTLSDHIRDLELEITENKRKYAQILSENVDLKYEIARMRARLHYYELFSTEACQICVEKAVRNELEGMNNGRN